MRHWLGSKLSEARCGRRRRGSTFRSPSLPGSFWRPCTCRAARGPWCSWPSTASSQEEAFRALLDSLRHQGHIAESPQAGFNSWTGRG